MLSTTFFLIVAQGLAVGLLLGATGAGGAIISVPILTLFSHLSVSQAGPIGLLAITLSAGLAASLGLREGIVRYKAAVLMSVLGLCLSPLGFWVAQRLPNPPLVIIFAAVLVYVAIKMWRNSGKSIPNEAADSISKTTFACERSDETGKFVWTLPCARALAFSGGVAGFMSGLIGVGGGFIIVPSLKKHTNLDMHSVVATSLAVITLVSAGGVIVSASQGNMNWEIGIPFSIGTMLGMVVGRKIGKKLPSHVLTKGFACLAIFAACLMLGKLLF